MKIELYMAHLVKNYQKSIMMLCHCAIYQVAATTPLSPVKSMSCFFQPIFVENTGCTFHFLFEWKVKL